MTRHRTVPCCASDGPVAVAVARRGRDGIHHFEPRRVGGGGATHGGRIRTASRAAGARIARARASRRRRARVRSRAARRPTRGSASGN
eukprot:31377-Pelagococcus_subviridis.AAC.13